MIQSKMLLLLHVPVFKVDVLGASLGFSQHCFHLRINGFGKLGFLSPKRRKLRKLAVRETKDITLCVYKERPCLCELPTETTGICIFLFPLQRTDLPLGSRMVPCRTISTAPDRMLWTSSKSGMREAMLARPGAHCCRVSPHSKTPRSILTTCSA